MWKNKENTVNKMLKGGGVFVFVSNLEKQLEIHPQVKNYYFLFNPLFSGFFGFYTYTHP